MKIEIHVYNHDDGVVAQLASLTQAIHHLKIEVRAMHPLITDVVDSVAAQRGEINSMKVFILNLEQAIRDALSGVTLPPPVEAALKGVFTEVKANTKDIVEAIDNDPATPAPPPPPEPTP